MKLNDGVEDGEKEGIKLERGALEEITEYTKEEEDNRDRVMKTRRDTRGDK